MDISYFREFVILAETKNFWAASERLFIGQSSLSKHIKTLELQLGAPLFARTSRKVELTEFGAKMLPYAQSIAKLQYEYEAAAFNYLNAGSETLNIACIPAMAQYNITNVLIRFQLDFPAVQVNTQEADTLVVRERLISRKSDLGIFRDSVAYQEHDPDKESQLVKIPYCSDRLVAVLPRDHPLAGAERLELPQLQKEAFSLIRAGTMPYDLCMRVCREAGFTPKVSFTSHSLNSVLDMVTKGGCVALLFSNHVANLLDSSVAVTPPFSAVPITPEIQTTLYLAYLKDVPLSRAARQFIDYCTIYAADTPLTAGRAPISGDAPPDQPQR